MSYDYNYMVMHMVEMNDLIIETVRDHLQIIAGQLEDAVDGLDEAMKRIGEVRTNYLSALNGIRGIETLLKDVLSGDKDGK